VAMRAKIASILGHILVRKVPNVGSDDMGMCIMQAFSGLFPKDILKA
jgi:hypothetical protein